MDHRLWLRDIESFRHFICGTYYIPATILSQGFISKFSSMLASICIEIQNLNSCYNRIWDAPYPRIGVSLCNIISISIISAGNVIISS